MKNLFDCHNDCITKLKSNHKIDNYLKKFSDVNIVLAVYTTHLCEEKSIMYMQKAKHFASLYNDFTSFEDLHFLNYKNFELIKNLSPNFATMTWNYDNNLAGGAYGNEGLSKFGKFVLEEFEQKNILIDTAHLNEKSFMDIARITTKPIFCSHSAIYDLCNSKRNLKDYQCKIIAESNGFLGLCFVSEFLSGTSKSSISDVCDHLEYFATKYTTKNIGIGSDFFGTKHLPLGLKSYNDFEKLKNLMLKRGFKLSEIEDIFYNNFNRFLKNSIKNKGLC